jgi:hypothetical protein
MYKKYNFHFIKNNLLRVKVKCKYHVNLKLFIVIDD